MPTNIFAGKQSATLVLKHIILRTGKLWLQKTFIYLCSQIILKHHSMYNINTEANRPVASRVLIIAFLLFMLAIIPAANGQNVVVKAIPGDGNALINWESAAGVDSVVVIGGRTITATAEAPLSSPLLVSGLDNGKLYAFEVYFHPTKWPVVDVGVLYAIPGEPAVVRNLKATGAHNSVTLTWEAPVAGSDYTYNIISATGEKIEAGANATTYTINNLTNGVAQTFRITAIRTFTDFPGKEKESWTKIKLAAISDEIVATPADTREARISAQAGSIVVTTPRGGELQVISIGGQAVAKLVLGSGTTTVPLPKGIYFVAMGDVKEKIYVN